MDNLDSVARMRQRLSNIAYEFFQEAIARETPLKNPETQLVLCLLEALTARNESSELPGDGTTRPRGTALNHSEKTNAFRKRTTKNSKRRAARQ
jgi:hypothetical protein